MPTDFASQLFATPGQGRFADALDMILASFKDEDDSSRFFITMFAWEQMVQDYAPAREATRVERDAQVRDNGTERRCASCARLRAGRLGTLTFLWGPMRMNLSWRARSIPVPAGCR
jgi:hypothetical protein